MGGMRILHLTWLGFHAESLSILTDSVSWSDLGSSLGGRLSARDFGSGQSARLMNSRRRNEIPHLVYIRFSFLFTRNPFCTNCCHRQNHWRGDRFLGWGCSQRNGNSQKHGSYVPPHNRHKLRWRLSI